MIAFKSRIFQTQIFWKFCMKTSRFTDSQIIAILKQAKVDHLFLNSAANMASATPRSTSGAPSSAAWTPR